MSVSMSVTTNLCGRPTKKGAAPCKKMCVAGTFGCWVHKDPCSCCFEQLSKAHTVTAGACGHEFHRECLDTWTNTDARMIKSCPMCRGPLSEMWQWQSPKVVPAGPLSWTIQNATHARSLIAAIEKTGRAVADDMEIKQMTASFAIVDLIGGIGGIDFDRIYEIGDTVLDVKDGQFTYKFFMVEPLQLTIPVTMLSTFNLYFNLLVLKGHLQNLVTL